MKNIPHRYLRAYMNVWPPFLGAGIRVKRLQRDFKAINVEMKLRWWNANWVGTHYGGSLYSMTDPFFMVVLIENLGRDYVVWDKSAAIRFRKPGTGTVKAQFRLSEEQVQEIREAVKNKVREDTKFSAEVKEEAGGVHGVEQ